VGGGRRFVGVPRPALIPRVQVRRRFVQFTTVGLGAEHDLDVVDKNVKVDFVNGARIDINLGLGQF